MNIEILNPTLKSEIAKKLRLMREEIGLDKKEFCSSLTEYMRSTYPPESHDNDDMWRDEDGNEYYSIKYDAYSKWEAGINLIPLDILVLICKYYNCDIGFFAGEYEEKKKDTSNICKVLGLSEKAVTNLEDTQDMIGGINYLDMTDRNLKDDYSNMLSKVIESDGFKDLLMTFYHLVRIYSFVSGYKKPFSGISELGIFQDKVKDMKNTRIELLENCTDILQSIINYDECVKDAERSILYFLKNAYNSPGFEKKFGI